MKIDNRNLAYGLVIAALLLAFLIYGRPLLVPLAFALLLWAVLNALVRQLRHFHFPAWLAWLSAFALIGLALWFVALILTNEAAAVAEVTPVYVAKLQNIWVSFGALNKLAPGLDFETLMKDTDVPGVLGSTAASIGDILVKLSLVVIYVGFLLAEQRYLPDKVARLLKGAHEGEGTAVFQAIGHQIQSYLGVCTLLSFIMAVVTYALLWAFGVEFAGFWALLMFFLTYIPTVGAVGVALPALMALAQFGEIGPALAILTVLILTHTFLTNVVETVLLGRSLDLSPFAIIVSLTFWGLIWGVAGLFLAVPLTGAIAIAFRHIEGLEWIADLIAGPPRRERKRAKLG